VAWKEEVLQLAKDIGTSFDTLEAQTKAIRERTIKVADQAAAMRQQEWSMGEPGGDLLNTRKSMALMMREVLFHLFESEVFIHKNFIVRCAGLEQLIKDIVGSGIGEENYTVKSVIVLDRFPDCAMQFHNYGAAELAPDCVGMVVQLTAGVNVEATLLLEFTLKVSPNSFILSPVRLGRICGSDPAANDEIIRQVDASLRSGRFPLERPLQLPNLGARRLNPIGHITTNTGVMVLDDHIPGIRSRHAPKALDVQGDYDAYVILYEDDLVKLINPQLDVLSGKFSADFRPVHLRIGSALRFKTVEQAIEFDLHVSFLQQGGDNPCEWEISMGASGLVTLRFARIGSGTLKIFVSANSLTAGNASFRWRQDLSPCKLFAPDPVINMFLGFIGEIKIDLGNQGFGPISIPTPGANDVKAIIVDQAVLVTFKLLFC